MQLRSALARHLIVWTLPFAYVLTCPLYIFAVGDAFLRDGDDANLWQELWLPLLLLVLLAAAGSLAERKLRGSFLLYVLLLGQLLIFLAWLASQQGVRGQALWHPGRLAAVGGSSPVVEASPASLPAAAAAAQQPARAIPRSKEPDGGPSVAPATGAGADVEARPADDLALGSPGKISVVLPCASEGQYATKTVGSFCNRTPEEVLAEIIVVDDGSKELMSSILQGVPKRCRLRVLRHEETMGLMVAKQTGGDAAIGEFIGFFDCHVAPNQGWHEEILEKLQARWRRLVVPLITDLDLDAWDEKPRSAVNSKCYIDWNCEFMWFEDGSDFIPIISGGLVATSQRWWRASGGFDRGMRGWGGENVDQSLRAWLCGGDIVRAKRSRVAHMWRVPEDKRTQAHYHTKHADNTRRAAAAWFDDFSGKYKNGVLLADPLNISAIEDTKKALECKPFAHFLHRFRKIYRDGGLLPEKVFHLRGIGNGLCARRVGKRFRLAECRVAQAFHLANRHPHRGDKCCSGIRLWNTLDCLDRLDSSGPLPYYCDVTGHNANQRYTFETSGLIRHGTGRCLSVGSDDFLTGAHCNAATKWEMADAFAPEETKLYLEAVQKHHLLEDMPDN